MAKSMHILIAGAGIAGPALSILLSRLGHKCTIVERAPGFRESGQQIDVSGAGLKVVDALGVREAIWNCRIEDDGIKFIDASDGVVAAFPVTSGSANNLVQEYEIMRPDFARILYERSKQDVEYIFGDSIAGLSEQDQGLRARFARSGVERDFDVVVAADGLRSSTRDLAFGPTNTEIMSLKQYGGGFSIPWKPSDGSWTRAYNASGGRCVCLRPNVKNQTTIAILCQVTEDSGKVATMSIEDQKQEVMERFKNAGWETARVLKELEGAAGENFYLQEVSQTKSSSLVNGRAALLGDAGYCPGPVSGQGTTLALVGAYILAGCIASHSDIGEALRQYEIQGRPFFDKGQKLIPGVPWIVNPQTDLGISVLNSVVWVAGLVFNSGLGTVLGKLGGWIPSVSGKEPKLPDYPTLSLAMSGKEGSYTGSGNC